MEAEADSTASAASPRPSRLWPWFVGGFLLVFVGMLLLVHMTAMHPSGQYVVRSPLWHYYANGLPWLFGRSAVGPASGDASALVETGLLHLLFSAGGGGWRSRSGGGSASDGAGKPPNQALHLTSATCREEININSFYVTK